MRFPGFLAATVSAMIFMCGCSESSLDYVPEKADYVFYGNTGTFFKSKIWKMLKDSDSFEKEILKYLEDEFDVDKPEELLGNVSIWGRVGYPPEGAVICFDNGGAEKIFKNLRKKIRYEEYCGIEKSEIDGKEAFSAYSSFDEKKHYFLGIVREDDDILYVTFRDEAAIWEKDGINEAAGAVDPEAVVAVAVRTGAGAVAWDALTQGIFRDLDIDFGKVGISKIEVLYDDSEISIKGSIDISDLDV